MKFSISKIFSRVDSIQRRKKDIAFKGRVHTFPPQLSLLSLSAPPFSLPDFGSTLTVRKLFSSYGALLLLTRERMESLWLKSGIQGVASSAISLVGSFDGRVAGLVYAVGRGKSRVAAPPQKTAPSPSSSRFSFR